MAGFTAAEVTAVAQHLGQESGHSSRDSVEGNSSLLSEYLGYAGLVSIRGSVVMEVAGEVLTRGDVLVDFDVVG